jgi:NAD(P)-dependent dehydrogenase (short-subunit alcohol dehydrogenase family)
MHFSDKVVVITGAAGGLGTAFTRRFLAEGARVCATDTAAPPLARLAQELGAPAGLMTIEADITSEADCQRLADRVRAEWGTADVVVNNAGWFPFREFEDISAQEWERVVGVNLTGPFLVVRAFLPLLKASRAGRIINISSGSVLAPPSTQAHYVAAKAGVVGFTRAAAVSLGGHGITVNAILPGVVSTPAAVASFPPGLIDMIAAQGAIKRAEVAEDVVGPVVFFASDDAAFVTGQSLSVDGDRHFL